MSWNPALQPNCPSSSQIDQIETLIIPRAHDLGGFEVRRALPSSKRRMVGPFIFFDQMGPAEFISGSGIDVRPHPHIGLATVTYLYQGQMHHRDSLGTSMIIQPGEVNWMTAGRGITHSERTAETIRQQSHALFGIQTWVALPEDLEETEPMFEHQKRSALPIIEDNDKTVTLILGSVYGQHSPVSVYSQMFYADVVLQRAAKLPLDTEHEDRGLYIVTGEIDVAGQVFPAGQMMTFRPGDEITICATEHSRLMLLGGESLGKRYIWWNFVASSKEKIEAAKQSWREGDWQQGRFRLPPDDDQEFIPLPDK